MESMLLDAAGHRRSPATMPGYHRGRPPRNKGGQYPADPPTVEEIVAVMRAVGDRPDSHRLRALIVCCGVPGFGSAKRSLSGERPGPIPWRSPHPAREGRQEARGRDGPLGLGTARPVA
jgi:hypothetical protein